MRSEYRTCDLAHELGEQVKELEADYGLFVEIVSSQEEQLAIIEGSEQLATEQALAAEAKVKELEAKLEEQYAFATKCVNKISFYRAALDKLARLGNEPHYGNSDGNCIARKALEQSDGKDTQTHTENTQ